MGASIRAGTLPATRNAANTALLRAPCRRAGDVRIHAMRMRKGSRGVTLIELCVGLAIVATLAGLAVPGFRASLRAAAVRARHLRAAGGPAADARGVHRRRRARACFARAMRPETASPGRHAGRILARVPRDGWPPRSAGRAALPAGRRACAPSRSPARVLARFARRQHRHSNYLRFAGRRAAARHRHQPGWPRARHAAPRTPRAVNAHTSLARGFTLHRSAGRARGAVGGPARRRRHAARAACAPRRQSLRRVAASGLLRDMAERIRANPAARRVYDTARAAASAARDATPRGCDVATTGRRGPRALRNPRRAPLLPAMKPRDASNSRPPSAPPHPTAIVISLRWQDPRADDAGRRSRCKCWQPPVAG